MECLPWRIMKPWQENNYKISWELWRVSYSWGREPKKGELERGRGSDHNGKCRAGSSLDGRVVYWVTSTRAGHGHQASRSNPERAGMIVSRTGELGHHCAQEAWSARCPEDRAAGRWSPGRVWSQGCQGIWGHGLVSGLVAKAKHHWMSSYPPHHQPGSSSEQPEDFVLQCPFGTL